MKKRTWTFFLAAALAVSVLSGCGDSRETESSAKAREEQEDEKESPALQKTSADSEAEKIWVCTKETYYCPDGSIDWWNSYSWEYDNYGNRTKESAGWTGSGSWIEYEYMALPAQL